MNLPIELPEELGHRIEGEATKRGKAVGAFLVLLIGAVHRTRLGEAEDPVMRDLAAEITLYAQSITGDREHRSGKTLGLRPGLFAEAGAPEHPLSSTGLSDPTLALFARWAEEDATDDPEETARRERVDEETAAQLRQNRFSLEGRTDFRRLAEEQDEEQDAEAAA